MNIQVGEYEYIWYQIFDFIFDYPTNYRPLVCMYTYVCTYDVWFVSTSTYVVYIRIYMYL